MRGRLLALGVAGSLLLAPAPAWAADPGGGALTGSQGSHTSGGTNGSTVVLTNTGTTPGGTTPGTPGGGSAGGGGGSSAPIRKVFLIGPCPLAPDGSRQTYYGYERLVRATWQMIPGTAGCHPDNQPDPPPPPPTPAEVTQAASETVQERIDVSVEAFSVAPDGRTLANLATRFRATAPQGVDGTLTNPLTGAAITYSITPRPLQWSFGDGGSATGTSVEHAYRRVGSYTVTLSAAWAVSFNAVGGTGPQTLPDATDATSRVVTVTEARARLVG